MTIKIVVFWQLFYFRDRKDQINVRYIFNNCFIPTIYKESNYIFNYIFLKIKSYRFETVLKFNDLYQTEIFIHDVKAYRKNVLLDKGYVIEIMTDAGQTGQWMSTLRYVRRSERDKDYEALIYKLKEYNMYKGE